MKTQFHENLTRLRKDRGYTQSEMAGKLHISRSTYTNYETGNRTPVYAVLENIGDILDCSLDELFGREKRYVTYCDTIGEEVTPYESSVKASNFPKLAIGVQNFRDLREKQAYYVDKTHFIEEFLESWYQITLITRPRRFGKTLNMSMLAEFLDCTKDSTDIFEGTKISKSHFAGEMNQHPVIYLSFLNVKADHADALCKSLKDTVRAEYERYYQIIDNSSIPEFEKKNFREFMKAYVQRTTERIWRTILSVPLWYCARS